jgi:hypothetical protein
LLLGAEQFAEVRIVVGLTVPFAGAAVAGNHMQMDLGVEVHEEGVVVWSTGTFRLEVATESEGIRRDFRDRSADSAWCLCLP